MVDLATTRTADGVRLDGAWQQSESAAVEPAAAELEPTGAGSVCDSVLCLHGTGSNFYSSRLLNELTGHFVAAGLPVLRANTRGHDLVCALDSRRMGGAALEIVADCTLDIAAWLNWLGDRGRCRVLLLGHSLGAIKVLYALAHEPLERVAAAAAISPPRLSFAHFSASARRAEFQRDLAAAEECVRKGVPEALLPVEFPIQYMVSAAGYVDKYGPGERYNPLPLLERLPCPALIAFGSDELQSVAFAGLPDAIGEAIRGQKAARVQMAIIAGADHQYTAVQADLAAQLLRWLRRLP